MTTYLSGDVVLVEGVVMSDAYDIRDEVEVNFPFATDPAGLMDGVTVFVPHVSVVRCYHTTEHAIDNSYVTSEGFYEGEE